MTIGGGQWRKEKTVLVAMGGGRWRKEITVREGFVDKSFTKRRVSRRKLYWVFFLYDGVWKARKYTPFFIGHDFLSSLLSRLHDLLRFCSLPVVILICDWCFFPYKDLIICHQDKRLPLFLIWTPSISPWISWVVSANFAESNASKAHPCDIFVLLLPILL